jgi:hypothetical protein
MNKKNYFLIALALVLATVYVVYFTHWFRAKTIQISCASRPERTARAGAATDQLFFALDDYYSLTEIKVIPLAALKTNKFALPVWHLVSDEGSDDMKMFLYGGRIPGMDPAIDGSRPEPLESGVTYHLFIAAGRAKGQLDFQLGAPPADSSPSPPKPDNSDN